MATVTIDLTCNLQKAVQVQYLNGNMFSADNAGNTINVYVMDGEEPATIGGSVSASVIRADGSTVAVSGALEGNKAYVILPQACYAVPGVISIVIKNTQNSTVTTIAALVANVYQSSTDVVVDPGTIIPSVQNLIAAIDAAIASIPADYSSLWTSLAPAFSTSTAYTVGQYVTYNGGLYRFVADHAAGTWNSAHVVAANLGNDISALKSAYDENFTPTNLAENATYTGYYYVNYTDGTNKAGNSYKASSMIDISGCTKIMYDRLYTSLSSSYAGIAFYDENQAFIANSGIPAMFNQSVGGYILESADVPTGAKYVRLSGGRTWTTVMRVYEYNDYMAKVPARLDNNDLEITQLENDVQTTNTRIDNIGKKEPITNIMAFRRGYWNSVDSFKTTTNYRVGCPTPITFDKTVYLCALNGFAMGGYRGGTFFTNAGVVTVPANTELKLFIRRLYENESETADVDEFTNGIYVLNYNPSSEYELNENTFAGIEMFRTAGFIGDSYTATRLGYSWVDILQNITGVQSTKFAKSGADSGTWRNASSYGLPALLNDSPKDLYWMALGINDGDRVDSNHSYLGSVADLSGSYASYPDTFWGNTGCIIESIQSFAPNAKIVLYKPIFTSVIRTLAGQSATQNGIKEVRDAIGEIAQHYSLPVMDALDDVLFQSTWYGNSMDSAVSAGTHPSVALYPAIAKANMRLMSKCIQANGDYFRNLRYDT